MSETKTSDEWQKLCRMVVLDPDGWDRQNWQYSWYEKQITRQEFERRSFRSTCMGSYDDESNNNGIWRDKA